MFLIAGLGNKGDKYDRTRHNIGFEVVKELLEKYEFDKPSEKYDSIFAQGKIGNHKCIILMPQTFMNNSGIGVGKAANFYKIPPEKTIVIHDELDLEPFKIRIKKGGGNGGHNGLKSIDSHFGKEYLRVRYGIGHPGDKDLVSGYVLSRFMKEEQEMVEKSVPIVADNFGMILDGKAEDFMTKYALELSKI